MTTNARDLVWQQPNPRRPRTLAGEDAFGERLRTIIALDVAWADAVWILASTSVARVPHAFDLLRAVES